MNEDDLSARCAEPEEDDQQLRGIEVSFAVPTYLTPSQQDRLRSLLTEIVNNPKNQPKEGVHWLGFTGGKMNYSRVDCMLLGKHQGPLPPDDGEEPECDSSVLCFGSMARPFSSEKEREKVLEERRPSEFTCPKCGGHSFGSNSDCGQYVRCCNGRGQRGTINGAGRFVPVEGPDEPSIRCDFTWPETDDAKYGLKPLR